MNREEAYRYRAYKERQALMRKLVVRQLEVLFDLEDYLLLSSEDRVIPTGLSEAYSSVERAFGALRSAREKEVADAIGRV